MQSDPVMDKLIIRFGGDEKKARAVWRIKNSYRKIEEARAAKSIKLIDIHDVPVRSVSCEKKSTQTVTCQATTLSGRPCKFKATCGNFCKKHMI